MNVLSEMDENLYDGKMCVFIFNFMHNKYTFFKKLTKNNDNTCISKK